MKIDMDLYFEIEKRTYTEYNFISMDKERKEVLISPDNIEPMLEDLLNEIYRLEEQIEDMKQDVEENYKRISVEEQL